MHKRPNANANDHYGSKSYSNAHLCITGYFYNEMRYINLHFTYLLTYLQ